ncbi:hypothetical protein LSH36_517g05000 [Paralvinella palmiformis]|uniref:Uncharacterized protein n=1 Tax=Paralvinella palmiformis TaxID=53620 RepID=A0AAD9MYW9_9ANNE|nr:hypothetical protein LSH36_517g05000 [Paralvinella palmiformis]
MVYILGQTSVESMFQPTRQQIRQWILRRNTSTLFIGRVTLHKKNKSKEISSSRPVHTEMFELYGEFYTTNTACINYDDDGGNNDNDDDDHHHGDNDDSEDDGGNNSYSGSDEDCDCCRVGDDDDNGINHVDQCNDN